RPLSPKVITGLPVNASTACSHESRENKMRLSPPSSQYDTPRMITLLAFSLGILHSSAPVAASRANGSAFAVTAYNLPLTIIGLHCTWPLSPVWYSHAIFSRLTLEASIWVRVE